MALQSSGAISLLNVQSEFGGSAPISLNEYYRTPYGAYVTSNNTSVPTTGAISLSNFYGASDQFTFHISSNTQNANIRTLAVNAGWDGSSPLIANVLSGIYLWSDSTSTGGAIIAGSFPAGLTFNNYGKIIGRGGNGVITGAGGNGGPALTVASSGVAVVNKSGAYIAGGGGGGGGYDNLLGGNSQTTGYGAGGAGGGVGVGGGGGGGAIGALGANGTASSSRDQAFSPGQGGGAGGGGGGFISRNSGTTIEGAGGGGRQLPGTGGASGFLGGSTAGGSAGNAAVNSIRGGGGGGWGANGGNGGGGSGGSGGAAISGTSVSLTNSGTIYGST